MHGLALSLWFSDDPLAKGVWGRVVLRMGEVRSGVASLIEVFLRDVLRLEGETEAQVRERVPIHVAEYERMFRDSQLEEGNKDLAARVCRALCRRSVIKEMAKRGGTPTEAHLQIVLSTIAPPGFSSKDYADAPPLSSGPWSIDEQTESFIVKDATRLPIAYVYFEDEPRRQISMQRLSRHEAFLIAVSIAKLPRVPPSILKDIPRPPNSASQ